MADLPTWLTVLLGLQAAATTTAASVWVARRARLGAIDQATHEKRLEIYPKLVEATSALAIYFPACDSTGRAISRTKCQAVGREMCQWYFEAGGLMMSVQARDAYFRLAHALTRASLAPGKLDVPRFPVDAEIMSKEEIGHYCSQLAEKLAVDNFNKWIQETENINKWVFGVTASRPEGANSEPYQKFRDYVLLQQLSSLLRTELSLDLHSRRRLFTSIG